MKVLISDIYNIVGDSLLRVLNSNTDYELHVLSDRISKNYQNKKVFAYKVDFLDLKRVKDIVYKIKPDLIINTHDYGDIYSKEKLKIQTTNVQSPENMLSICRVLDCRLIGISNEFVFDGSRGQYTEDTKAGNENYYGTTKHAFENTALTTVKNSAIIRHSLIYGHNSYGYKDLCTDLINALSEEKEFEIKNNYFVNPVLADEFAQLVIKIIENKSVGIYHASGPEYLSVFDFAKKLADFFDLNPDLIKFNPLGQELKFGLNSKKTEAQFNITFANLRSGLTAFMYYIYGDSVLPLELF